LWSERFKQQTTSFSSPAVAGAEMDSVNGNTCSDISDFVKIKSLSTEKVAFDRKRRPRAQPTSQPKPVAASFKGEDNPLDDLARLNRLITPASKKMQGRAQRGDETFRAQPETWVQILLFESLVTH
jgi:hypothetical protein